MRRSRVAAWVGLGVFTLAAEAAGCGGDDITVNPLDASTADGTVITDGAPAGDAATALATVPQTGSLTGAGLSAPVDLVRDEWGNPHIYGKTVADVAYVQGYVTAQDRIIQLEFERHFAAGRIAELAGALSASAVDSDIAMRMHHMESDAQKEWTALQAATDDVSKACVALLNSYAAGVNAYVADLVAGKYPAPTGNLALIYKPASATPWRPIDSLMLGQLEAYDLAYDSDAEITSSLVDQEVAAVYGADSLRKDLDKDLQLTAPQDPTTTITGWTGADGTRASAPKSAGNGFDPQLRDLLRKDQKVVEGLGDDHKEFPERGSNNWIVGPSLSKTGNVLVANDTHLGLTNPATFYIVHLHADDAAFPLNVMGESFPGIPGVILGMTQHTAWGATVSNIDVTDVYKDSIAPCAGSDAGPDGGAGSSPCTTYKSAAVPLTPRVEQFGVGLGGAVGKTISITMYDDPNHGPIIPRPNATHDGIEPLGATELAVSYTGYTPSQLVRYVFNLDRANSMKDVFAALDADFDYGGQNWVVGDDQGNFGWSQYVKVPRRASATLEPWKVLPGDGTDDWVGTLDPKYIPHSYNPAAGFLATANADPIGVTLSNSPFLGQPNGPDGLPLYLGWQYDSGTRVGRITKRLQAATASGAKVGLDDLQSVQADATTEWGQAFNPTILAAANALKAEVTTPGTNLDLSTLALGLTTQEKAVLDAYLPIMTGWTFDTPSATATDGTSTAAQIADSQATLMYDQWFDFFQHDALADEFAALNVSIGTQFEEKLLAKACNDPTHLAEGMSTTGDPILFDDVTTVAVESKRFIAARALVRAIDALSTRLGNDSTTWRWGTVHSLTLNFFSAGLGPAIPGADAGFPNGFPRHGDVGTVDVGSHGFAPATTTTASDFTYANGPAIRFVAELTKDGPVARNALPGGAIYDPNSPHYADQMELWRKNQTYDLAYKDADVVTTANKELTAHGDGRIVFSP